MRFQEYLNCITGNFLFFEDFSIFVLFFEIFVDRQVVLNSWLIHHQEQSFGDSDATDFPKEG